jgi:hypothetical protein
MQMQMKQWQIGISSWIIQDGNYEDFKIGDQSKFAIEFYSENMEKTNSNSKKAIIKSKAIYEINAEVVFNGEDFIVIDFGLLAYQELHGKNKISKGDWIKGNFYLGIDPFFYSENGYKIKGIQPLIYSWIIEDILIETAPFIESTDSFGRKIQTRDDAKSLLKSISETNAWNDDNGDAEYVLKCTLESDQSQYKR